MKSWEIEKSGSVIDHLAKIVDVLKNDSSQDDIKDHLAYALNDATKIWAYFYDALSEWKPGDPERIMDRGSEGIEELAVFYGALKETALSKEIRESREALSKIREYIQGPRSPNRTLIHDVLSPLDHKKPWIDKVESLTMTVSMGEKEWSDYIEEIPPLLDEWEDQICVKESELKERMHRP